MSTYTAITSGQIDADSPLDVTLAGQWTNNLLAVIEGDASAPDIVGAAFPAITGGTSYNHAWVFGTSATVTDNSTPVDSLIRWCPLRPGTYRFDWTMVEEAGSDSYFSRLYTNGSGASGSSIQTVASGGGSVNKNDTIAVAAGDLVSVYHWTGTTGATAAGHIVNLRVRSASTLLG